MEITDIRVRKVAADGKLKAYVTVTFDDCFVVHNVKVIEGKNGAFMAPNSHAVTSLVATDRCLARPAPLPQSFGWPNEQNRSDRPAATGGASRGATLSPTPAAENITPPHSTQYGLPPITSRCRSDCYCSLVGARKPIDDTHLRRGRSRKQAARAEYAGSA